jgi:hypothetical protein
LYSPERSRLPNTVKVRCNGLIGTPFCNTNHNYINEKETFAFDITPIARIAKCIEVSARRFIRVVTWINTALPILLPSVLLFAWTMLTDTTVAFKVISLK